MQALEKTQEPVCEPRIQIRDVGPISGTFDIDLSGGPGLYVLHGEKGAGKSKTIECIELLAGHKVDLSLRPRDGALDDGRLSGFGSVIPVTRARIGQRKGEFEAAALDAEKFSIADVTDPGIKDPVKADAHRIKAIASLTRAKTSPADYYGLVGGQEEFERLIRPAELQVDDPVLMAARIKSAFDGAARQCESLADRAEGQAHACAAATAGLDLESSADPAELAAAVDAAVVERSRLATLAQEAARSQRLRSDAEAKLAKTRSDYAAQDGPTVARAEAMQAQANKDVDAATKRVNELRDALRAAQEESAKASARLAQANAAVVSARQHAELVSQLEDLINRDTVTAPTQEETEAADRALTEARAALELGVRIRDARRRVEDGDEHLAESQRQRVRAAQLREAAKQTFDVLMSSVKVTGIRIQTIKESPRLVVDHPRRGPTLFGELSDGERVMTTINLLLPLIRRDDSELPGVFPISQRLFQDLPASDLDQIAAYAREHGLFVFGARVDHGPLRIERWGTAAMSQQRGERHALYEQC